MQNNLFFQLPKRNRKIETIPYSDILYLEGDINYTIIHLQNGKIKVSPRTLLFHINNSLDEGFIRIHRAFCVNKLYIQSYDRNEAPDYLWLTGGVKLSVSRRKQKELLAMNQSFKIYSPLSCL